MHEAISRRAYVSDPQRHVSVFGCRANVPFHSTNRNNNSTVSAMKKIKMSPGIIPVGVGRLVGINYLVYIQYTPVSARTVNSLVSNEDQAL